MLLILDLGWQSEGTGMVIFWYSDKKQISLFLFIENYLSPSSPAACWRAYLGNILQQIRAGIKYILQGALLLPSLCCVCWPPGVKCQHLPGERLWNWGAQATLQKAQALPCLRANMATLVQRPWGRSTHPRHRRRKLCTSYVPAPWRGAPFIDAILSDSHTSATCWKREPSGLRSLWHLPNALYSGTITPTAK